MVVVFLEPWKNMKCLLMKLHVEVGLAPIQVSLAHLD